MIPPFTEHQTPHALVIDLGRRPSRTIQATGAIGAAFSLVFGTGYGIKHLALPSDPDLPAAVIGLAVCTLVFLTGLVMVASAASFAVTTTRIYTRDRLGPVALVRSRPLNDLLRIETRFDEVVVNGRRLEGPDRLGGLRLVLADGRRLTAAVAYPASVLIPLAVRLAELCEAATPHLGPLELAEVTPQDRLNPAEPPTTPARLRERETPATYQIAAPSQGIRRGGHGLFTFALFWNAVVLAMAAVVFRLDPSSDHAGPFGTPPMTPLLALFALIGVGLTLYAVHLARLRVLFTIDAHTLRIERRSPFTRSERIVARPLIRAIRVAPSSVTVNDTPLNELHIELVAEPALELLSHLPDDELASIAAILRTRLRVPATPEAQSTHPFSTRRAG